MLKIPEIHNVQDNFLRKKLKDFVKIITHLQWKHSNKLQCSKINSTCSIPLLIYMQLQTASNDCLFPLTSF